MTALHELLCDSSAALRARQWLSGTLERELPDQPARVELIADALLCASELVTNALQAGCTTLRIRTRLTDDHLVLAVIDDAPGAPTERVPGPDDPRGRGLMIVAAVAAEWGCRPLGKAKEVWARLPRC